MIYKSDVRLAQEAPKPKLTLSCHPNGSVMAETENGGKQYASYDFFMSKAEQYEIIDNTTSACKGSGENGGTETDSPTDGTGANTEVSSEMSPLVIYGGLGVAALALFAFLRR